jgi:hypothetical protein
MKKLLFTALIAVSLFAARPSHKDAPMPECNPCPFVR